MPALPPDQRWKRSLNSPTYKFEREKLGQLDCGIVCPTDADAEISSVAVLAHGYGAGGDDLVGLANELLQIAPLDNPTMLVFPAAPHSLEDEGIPGGRAWWKLSIQRLISAIESGQYELVREEEPSGIDEARQMLVETVQLALDRCKLDASKLLLGGFSQGAMLSMDVACRGLEEPPAGLCLYSACLICERQWQPRAEKLQHTAHSSKPRAT